MRYLDEASANPTGDRRPRCEHGCSINDTCSICDNEEFSPEVATVRAAVHRDEHPDLYHGSEGGR